MLETRRFLKSAARFLWRVGKRSIYGIFFLLLRWSDIYESGIRHNIPESWTGSADRLMGIIDVGALWIAVLIVICSVLWTYYEVDREIRDPRTTRRLKSFYNGFAELISREISSADEFESLKNDLKAKTNELLDWVEHNMDSASMTRLRQKGRTGFANFTFKRDDAFNYEHSELVDTMIDRQERVALLIERTAWV